MNIKKLKLNSSDYPSILRNIPSPPKALYAVGESLNELLKRPRLAIVGSRKVSPYGEQVTTRLASQLAEQGIIIVSGLAFGVDALAHRAALEAGEPVIAVLPSPLNNILPVANQRLAEKIITAGGVLVSEYAPGEMPFKQNFIARNRLMSGLADAVLITEAAHKSGSLHTARFALEQNREVMAVPGSIFAEGCRGTNNLIKSMQAATVTEMEDVLHIMKIQRHTTAAKNVRGRNQNEQTILDLMLQGISAGDELLEKSGLNVIEFNQSLTMLEISSKIRALNSNNWAIY